ncbi:hypothetical protein BHU61_06755 [Macrococcus epidermidis]|uniref:DUF3168 domain-containing protein n=1 Tax=Macrococcus epidermidis TaxID=1902580 RepID=A0A327ZSH9_9STAP|nr:DUF3168 domain-containing protein [Macrococcus epidermidis]RAK45006.1 hypothetical protein BHU61_06755 [Macrococcus epidermidis]
MIDDPYKFIRDILIKSPDVTKLVPASNIKNLVIPEELKTKPPYIRISVIGTPDVEFGDGEIHASGIHFQIDIWQQNGLMTTGNIIKRLLKANGINFVDSLEPHTERITDYVSLYRDARRYYYAYELDEKDIY